MLDRIKRYVCPCCGGPIERALGSRGRPLFGPISQRIFDVIKCAPEGIAATGIMDRVYQGQPRAMQVIPTLVWHMNKKLKRMGLRIESTGGPGSVYYLIQT